MSFTMPDKEKILKMVAEGKISVEEAEKLIRAVGEKESPNQPTNDSLVVVKNRTGERKKLSGKVIIEIKSSKGENVKIKLPLKLANLGLNMIPKDKLHEFSKEGINLKEIIQNISNFVDDIDDDILNITSAGGDIVRVYIQKS
jgi:SHOCT-like domain